jgi:hypothetical protein
MLFAFVGQAGNAILFVLSLVALTIVASYTFAYAAHSYLVVAQATAAGLDRVDWGDDPILDWLYQALYVGGVVLIWLMPAGLLWRGLRNDFLPDDPGLRFLLLAVPGLWLLFPIGLLSSLASSSRWVPVSPRVLGRLLRIIPSQLLFYIITAGLFAAASALVYVGLFTPGWYVLLLAAVAGSAVLLVHARLLGRIAWLMGQLPTKPRAEKKASGPRKKQPKTAHARTGRRPKGTAAHDPWAAPEEEPPEEAPPPVRGYSVVEVEDKPPPRPTYVEPVPDPYTLTESAPEPQPLPQEPPILEREKANIEREIKLRERKPPNPPPALPLFSGVFNFPLYESSLKAWLWLTLGGLATGGFARMVLLFSPVGK